MRKGIHRASPETFTCDAYRFRAGESEAINAYRGEYICTYPSAGTTESILSGKTNIT